MAEILFTVLAGSLITIQGLNIMRPGTKTEKNALSDRVFEDNRLQVWRDRPWLHENLLASVHDMPVFKELRKQMEKIRSLSIEELKAQGEDFKQLRQQVVDLTAKADRTLQSGKPGGHKELKEAQELADEHSEEDFEALCFDLD
ncbi:hypothetical protein F4780DRAFT_780071 [Xylariomycetidae sp. FL0641]|nr:hypothetical protein F4780DRAFT_780071 [Xylariomycetidae sp. FL0641]